MAPSTRLANQAEVGSRSSSLSSPLRTPREEPPEREEDALAALQERVAAVTKRRDELLALQQLRELEEEVAQLEGCEQVAPQARVRNNVLTAQDLATRRQGAAELAGPAYAKRTLKPKDLAEYQGKTIKEYCEYVRSCEVAF